MTRRECLQTAAAAGAAVLAPTIVPASALGRGGAVAPSERIVLGAIGIGARGEFDLGWMLPEKDVQFVAICDVRKVRREHVKKLGACLGISIQVTSMDDQSVQVASIRPQCSFAPIPAA